MDVSKLLIELNGCSNYYLEELDDKLFDLTDVNDIERNLFRRTAGHSNSKMINMLKRKMLKEEIGEKNE